MNYQHGWVVFFFLFISHQPISQAIHNSFCQLIGEISAIESRPTNSPTAPGDAVYCRAFFRKYYEQGANGRDAWEGNSLTL